MKHLRQTALVRAACALAFSAMVACSPSNKPNVESTSDSNAEYQPTSGPHGTDGNCQAPSEWFSGSVPTPDPFAFPSDANNCDFHLISWQYFLWLTEEVSPGKLRFQTFYTDQAIHPETKDDTYQVLDIVEQALSKGILVDLQGRAVYSNIMINDVYRDFVLEKQLYDPEVFENFPDTVDFPVGSMSLKAAWKIVAEGEDTEGLFVTKSDVQELTLVNGNVRIPENPTIQKDVEVALVGLHIAVVVEGHPEFIWATWEWNDNAPDFKVGQKINEPVDDRDWLFYTANTPALNVNANNAGILAFVNEPAQLLAPVTQVGRQYRNGGGSDNNMVNIDTINSSVQRQLGSQSVWSNYFEVGAIWFDNDKGRLVPNWTPNNDPQSRITGSIQLSNSVIETFTQKVNAQNECFSCHNTMAVTSLPPGIPILPGKNINTSHILLKAYQNGGQVTRK